MTQLNCNTEAVVLVAIDISKARNDVFVELPDGTRRKFKVANKMEDYERFSAFLKELQCPCLIGFEATGNYHRPLAYYLHQQGFHLRLVSSLAVARTREAMYNSWDKNDPKDAQVILHLLKTGTSQTYCDPLASGFNDIQELSMAYFQVSMHKTRVQHSIVTHFLPLYFPETQKYLCSSRAEWFSELLLRFPNPQSVLKYTKDEFITIAWSVAGRKVNKRNWLADFYETARESIGLPMGEDSGSIEMFRTVLREHNHLCKLRRALEARAKRYLEGHPDYVRLQTIPGVGPIIALTSLLRPATQGVSAITGNSLTSAVSAYLHSNREGSGALPGYPSTTTLGCVTRFGSRLLSLSGSGRTHSERNMIAISNLIRQIPISSVRR
jgi:transposase